MLGYKKNNSFNMKCVTEPTINYFIVLPPLLFLIPVLYSNWILKGYELFSSHFLAKTICQIRPPNSGEF